MRAVTIVDEELHWSEHPDPTAGAGEVVVSVRAAGLNGADMLQRRGLYPAPPGWPQDIPGMEFSGTVLACGEGAVRFAPGTRVMGICGGGGQSERVVVPESTLLTVPDGVDLVAARRRTRCSARPTCVRTTPC
jgi:NADPH:quinone reductase-like Zn-dependent oxidoreductase